MNGIALSGIAVNGIAVIGAWIAGAALLATGGPLSAQAAARARTVPAAHAVDLGGIETKSAALMLSAQEAGDLGVAVTAIPLPGEDAAATGRSRIVLAVDVDGGSRLAGLPPPTPAVGGDDGGADPLITEIYAYALDARGRLAATLTRAFRLDLAASRQALAGGFQFFGHLDLPPGEYSLRVLVQQRRSGRLGLEIVPLTVPSWSGGGPVLLPPLALDAAGDRLLIFEEGEAPPPFPLTIDGVPRVPATRWRVQSGARSAFLLLGRALGEGPRAHLLGPGSTAPRELGLGDLRPIAGIGGLDAVAATLDAGGLEGGEYRLRVSLAAGPEASSPLSVRPAEDPGPWAAAEGLVAERPAAAAGGGRAGGARTERERAVRARDAYRRALAALAAGDQAAMLRPLVDLESREIGGGETDEQKRLGEAELSAAWELAGGDAEGLPPLLWIHGELYRQYHSRRLYQLATHSRRLLSRLADLYLERGARPENGHLAACALAGVAGYLHGIGALPAAEVAYEAVLDVEAGNPAALLGLAALAESYGDYPRAVQLLERLHGGPSPDPQVGLRLGVNLRRLGKSRDAEALLRAALAAPEPEWVAAIAAQELASLLAEEGRLDDAIAVLESAIARHPGLQRLPIQLAALHDRGGRPGAARAALDGLDLDAGRDAGSPRLRYSRMPTQALAEARRTLAEEALRRLPRLLGNPDSAPRQAAPGGS